MWILTTKHEKRVTLECGVPPQSKIGHCRKRDFGIPVFLYATLLNYFVWLAWFTVFLMAACNNKIHENFNAKRKRHGLASHSTGEGRGIRFHLGLSVSILID